MDPVASQHALHPRPADDGARQLAEHPPERPHGEGQQREQIGDLDQLTGGDVAGGEAVGADQQHREHAEGGQRLQHRVEQAAHPPGRDVGVAQRVGPGPEPVGLGVFAAERLHHQRALEALVGDLEHRGPQLLRPGGAAGRAGAGRRG